MRLRRKPRPSVWTATDSLLLDVEQVEKWASIVVADRDAPTSALANIVTRLRSSADLLADYLFRTSGPARRNARMRMRPRGHAAPDERRTGRAEKQGQGRDSGGRPQGVPSGPERSAPVAPTATNRSPSSTEPREGSHHE